jgi:hypothetical protein
MTEVSSIPLVLPVSLFIVYIITHYWFLKQSKILSESAQTNEELKNAQAWRFIAKWYPTGYLMIVLVILYSI